jgi:pSer/pThr/pTyr-binding forkhead associated (FHA) protein
MQVRLKILVGSNKGKEIKIPAPKCVIGRGDDCYLRPQSDAISRRHCEIVTSETEVLVRDLGSRNGTLVNGTRITEETVLLNGDVLMVGPLEFELVIEHTAAKLKRPQVKDIKEAAERTVTASSSSTHDLGDVTQWLDEADQAAKYRKVADPETRQFRIDDTATGLSSDESAIASTGDTKAEEPETPLNKRPEKKAPGKLPPRPAVQAKDSREAAADMLKKLFNRR